MVRQRCLKVNSVMKAAKVYEENGKPVDLS